MDTFQRKLRLLIVTGSAVGFIGGWGLLARAGKPAGTDQPIEDTTSPIVAAPTALPPIDFKSLESVGGSATQPVQPNLQSVPNTQSVPTFRPRIRTRSS